MSTVEPTARLDGPRAVTLPRVIRSEWTKLWSLRSTRWTLLVAVVAQAGFGPLVAAVQMSHWDLSTRLTFNAVNTSLVGRLFAEIAIGVLGVLVISGEYSSGQIRSTLMAVPKRLPVLWAKLIVFCAVTFLLILASALIGFFASQAILTQKHVNVGLGSTNALRCVVGAALEVTFIGALCTAFGTLVRATAGGISIFIVVLFVLPPVVTLLPDSIAHSLHPYLPSTASDTLATATRDGHTFSPWGGFALFVGYVVVMVVCAAVTLRRRDA